MEIIYILSTILIFVSFLIIKKTDKTINIINMLSIGLVLLLCYNTFICYILTFFNIPIQLWLLSAINILISSALIFYAVKKNKYQKYYFKKIDFAHILIIAIVVLIISYIQYGFPFNIKYEMGDASVHYLATTKFAQSDALLVNSNDLMYKTFNTMKPMAYVNTGLLMKCLCNQQDFIEYYQVFICFDIFILFLIGCSFYSAIIGFAKQKGHKLWAFLITLICILGYPLNGMLFGFEYMNVGLAILCAILNTIQLYHEKIIEFKWLLPILTLLNFGLFLAYYMFVPFVYSALWIYFCISNYKLIKKIVNKRLIAILFITLLIPFFLGYIYCLEPNIYALGNSILKINKSNQALKNSPSLDFAKTVATKNITHEGYIYINLYSNILLLLPLTIYLFYKRKENDLFVLLLVVFIFIFMEILLWGKAFDKVSIYYVSKNYFALWIILWYCNYRSLILLSEKTNYLPRLFISAYIILMIICTAFSNTRLRYWIHGNPDENIYSVMHIFGANKTLLFSREHTLIKEEIALIDYAKKFLLKESIKIEVIADQTGYYWQYAFLGDANREKYTKYAR